MNDNALLAAWMNFVSLKADEGPLSAERYYELEESFLLGAIAVLGNVAGDIANGIREHGTLTGPQIMDIFNGMLQEANDQLSNNPVQRNSLRKVR